MRFQTIVDSIGKAACVVSVEKTDGGTYGKVRVVTGNSAYIDTIEKHVGGMNMLRRKFVPDTEYTDYVARDLNFEEACYQAAVQKKCVHSYAHPTRYDIWFDIIQLGARYSPPVSSAFCICFRALLYSSSVS